MVGIRKTFLKTCGHFELSDNFLVETTSDKTFPKDGMFRMSHFCLGSYFCSKLIDTVHWSMNMSTRLCVHKFKRLYLRR
jgi:hypothetical protein